LSFSRSGAKPGRVKKSELGAAAASSSSVIMTTPTKGAALPRKTANHRENIQKSRQTLETKNICKKSLRYGQPGSEIFRGFQRFSETRPKT